MLFQLIETLFPYYNTFVFGAYVHLVLLIICDIDKVVPYIQECLIHGFFTFEPKCLGGAPYILKHQKLQNMQKLENTGQDLQ